jgi:hypothetical protein
MVVTKHARRTTPESTEPKVPTPVIKRTDNKKEKGFKQGGRTIHKGFIDINAGNIGVFNKPYKLGDKEARECFVSALESVYSHIDTSHIKNATSIVEWNEEKYDQLNEETWKIMEQMSVLREQSFNIEESDEYQALGKRYNELSLEATEILKGFRVESKEVGIPTTYLSEHMFKICLEWEDFFLKNKLKVVDKIKPYCTTLLAIHAHDLRRFDNEWEENELFLKRIRDVINRHFTSLDKSTTKEAEKLKSIVAEQKRKYQKRTETERNAVESLPNIIKQRESEVEAMVPLTATLFIKIKNDGDETGLLTKELEELNSKIELKIRANLIDCAAVHNPSFARGMTVDFFMGVEDKSNAYVAFEIQQRTYRTQQRAEIKLENTPEFGDRE